MTTPERLRRRQRLESLGVALVTLALLVAVGYFRERSDTIVNCVVSYSEEQSTTSTARARIVERESRVTRRVIRSGLRAADRQDVEEAAQAYDRSLRRIDRARARNPVPTFDLGDCASS